MSKKAETKKANDPVGEYLVEQIRNLEREVCDLNERINHLTMYKEQAEKFDQVKKLFKLSGGCVCLYDTNGEYESVVASTLGSFGRYLAKLLELGENE